MLTKEEKQFIIAVFMGLRNKFSTDFENEMIEKIIEKLSSGE